MVVSPKIVGSSNLLVAATSSCCTSACPSDDIFGWKVVARCGEHLVTTLAMVTCLVLVNICNILLGDWLVHPQK